MDFAENLRKSDVPENTKQFILADIYEMGLMKGFKKVLLRYCKNR